MIKQINILYRKIWNGDKKYIYCVEFLGYFGKNGVDSINSYKSFVFANNKNEIYEVYNIIK